MAAIGNWILTHKGHAFSFSHLDSNIYDLGDIAHALAMTCRYGGMTDYHYCPTEDQRILTADLRWIPAGEVKVGDGLWGFDEHPWQKGSASAKKRRYRPSVVTAVTKRQEIAYRLHLSDGSSVCATAEHPWLVCAKQSGNQKWRTVAWLSDALQKGRKQWMYRFFDTWDSEQTYAAGWLAGMFDGEGSFSCHNRGGSALGVSQKPGPALNRMMDELKNRRFDFGASENKKSGVVNLQIRGGMRENLRLLGTIRPDRLVSKAAEFLRDGPLQKQLAANERVEILSVEEIGERTIVAIATSTSTYFCEGFAAHNSVAQHSCYIAEELFRETGDAALALDGLMHDAEEAYMGDMNTPLKNMMPQFRVMSEEVDEFIRREFSKFGVPLEMQPLTKEYDTRILLDEKFALLPHGSPPLEWEVEKTHEPLGIVIQKWSPELAERRFRELFKFYSSVYGA